MKSGLSLDQDLAHSEYCMHGRCGQFYTHFTEEDTYSC